MTDDLQARAIRGLWGQLEFTIRQLYARGISFDEIEDECNTSLTEIRMEEESA